MDRFDLADGRCLALHCRTGRPGARSLIILHGMERDAARYLAQWSALDTDGSFNLIAPEFDQRQFPGWRGYNLGGEGPEFGAVFTALTLLANAFGGADFYGHSAGAQVVQRYVLFGNTEPDAMFIAANAGWYTAPEDTPFPYGLADGPICDLGQVFSRRLILLSGAGDVDANHRGLRHDEGATRQGANRLERAKWMMKCARQTASTTDTAFHWQHKIALAAGHSNRAMAPTAMQILLGR
ncbi:MAG: hypothetical protein ACPGGK_05565 [Pikeienuella sp.]